MAFTNKQKAKCAAREAALRKNVYRKFVERGTMAQEDADYELAVMQEIAADYSRVTDGASFEALQAAVQSMTQVEQQAFLARVMMLVRDLSQTSGVGKVDAGFDLTAGRA